MKKLIIALLLIFTLSFSFPVEVYSSEKPITDSVQMFSYINMDWWKELNDEFLTDYITRAVQCNHDLKLATLKVGENIENKNIKRANEMPTLGIGAVPALYKLPSQTTSDGLISLPMFVNYELDLFGKNRDKTKSFDKLIEISRQSERSAYISVASAVGSTYYNIVKLDKLIELQQKIILDRKKIYDLMKLSNEEGLVSTADTVNANKAYIKSNADLIELEKTRQKLLNMLCVLIGESPENTSDLKRISFDELVVNQKIPDSISSDLIEQRPDYIAAEKAIEKSGIDVRAAKKEFLPSFDIIGLISFNSTDYLSKMNWTNSLALLGANAMLPLFTGGRKIANLKLNKNKYEQAIENYRKTTLTSIQEINDALCDLKLDNEKYLKTLESYNAEQQDFGFTNLKFKEGIISDLDLLQKRESLLTTEKRLVDNKTDFFINKIALYKSLGGARIVRNSYFKS